MKRVGLVEFGNSFGRHQEIEPRIHAEFRKDRDALLFRGSVEFGDGGAAALRDRSTCC